MHPRHWAWFVAAVGLLAVVTAVPADEPPSSTARPADLSWVPPNSTAFLHIRAGELIASTVGRDAIKLLQSLEPKILDDFEKHVGFPLFRLDRVTVLLPDVIEEHGEPGFVIRLTTTRPYNREDVRRAFKPERDGQPPEVFNPKADLFRSRDGLVHFTDERNLTLILSKTGAVGLLGRFLGAKKTGPLTDALKLAADKNHVVAALDVTQLPRVPADQIPPDLRSFRILFDAKTAAVKANLVADSLQIEAALTFRSTDDATDGKQALEDGRKMLQSLIADGEQRLGQDAKANMVQLELLKELSAALKAAKIEQQTETLRVTGQLRTGPAMARILAEGTGALQISRDRTISTNNLKQIGLAFHNYHDVHNGMPLPAILDKNGKPLLSWRVAILPYIEQENLYRQFHLDEPWDSDHNKKLVAQMPKVYMLPGDTRKHDLPSTYYQVFVGNGAMFEQGKPTRLAHVTDGLSNTFMAVEAADPVPWTKPDDIAYDPTKPVKLGYHFGNTCNVLFGDGSVRAFKKGTDEKVLHLLIQRADGQVIPNIP